MLFSSCCRHFNAKRSQPMSVRPLALRQTAVVAVKALDACVDPHHIAGLASLVKYPRRKYLMKEAREFLPDFEIVAVMSHELQI